MSTFWEIVFLYTIAFFRRHVCLSKTRAVSREFPLTARKTVFSHLKELNSGLPRTNQAGGQGGTWTQGLRIASPAL